MENLSVFHRALLCAIAVSGLALSTSAAENKPITPSELDRAMASQAPTWRHATPAKTEAGKLLHASQNKQKVSANQNGSDNGSRNRSVRYPADLQFHGGPTIQFMESHAIYVNPSTHCPVPTCWGAPETFLKDLGKSEFVHVVDQYTGLYADNRYTVGSSARVTYPTFTHPYTDADMLAIVHAVAQASGQTGYGHEYHVFLKGHG